MKELYYKNIKISYSDFGEGTPLILLHGFLENKTMWDFFIPELSKENRIISIDLLGHGATESLGYVHTMEDQADLAHHVLCALKIKNALFIGHSMGGYVALAFVELFPDFMKGLILLNSTSKADSDERKQNRERAIVAVKQNYEMFVRMSIANLFSEKNREILIDEIENVKTEALKTPLQGVIAALEGMKIRKDREEILNFASFPIVLVLGKHDPVLNYNENKSQVDETAVELITLPDGHMSFIENRDEVLKLMLNFAKKS